MRVLVAGSTGFVGQRLTKKLIDDGHQVGCLVRNLERAEQLKRLGATLHLGDCLNYDSLETIPEGYDCAYYLVHSMSGAGEGDFTVNEQISAENFARVTKRQGVKRMIYLGGLGDRPRSRHLISRHKTAETLKQFGPSLTYFRAGMIVGAGSASYVTLRFLVERLPAMIAPAWLKVPTQPIYVDDAVDYLAEALSIIKTEGREIQIGGPDVVSYGQMLDVMAEALGKRARPKLPVPLLTPTISSLWIGLVTPVDSKLVRPLVESLSTETVVSDDSALTLFEIEPIGFFEGLTRAVAEEQAAI